MSYDQHNRLWGTRLGVKRKAPSQREYVQKVTGLEIKDNFKAYWLLQLAARPSARAWKRLTAEQQLAVQKLAEHQASGKGWEQFKFNQEWGID